MRGRGLGTRLGAVRLGKVKIQERKGKNLALAGKQNNTVLSSNKKWKEKQKKKKKTVHWPGVEPGSTAWKAAMLTVTPPMPAQGMDAQHWLLFHGECGGQDKTIHSYTWLHTGGIDATMLPRSCDHAPQTM